MGARGSLVSLRALCIAVALLAACAEEPAPEPLGPRLVKLLTVGDAEVGTLEYPGQIKAIQHADMGFEVPGRIIEFRVKEGQRVKRGAFLARLDARDYEAELDKARTNAAKTQADANRYQKLFDAGVTPQAELERYLRLDENMEANLRVASKAVEDTVLRAPFDGVVARKLVEDFANVQAKQAVLVVQDDSLLRIEAAIPERDFARMQPGLTLEERNARARPRVQVSSVAGREFPARASEFTTSADPATRTYRATFDFAPEPDVSVLPGMTAKVVLDVGGAAAAGPLRVPAAAVISGGEGGPFLWAVDPDTLVVAKAPVEVGALSGSWLEIRSGLAAGQTIATSGVHQLREGMTVRRFEP